MRTILILILNLVAATTLRAQITGNLNVVDPKALPITPELQSQLCEKQWWFVKEVETRRGIVTEAAKTSHRSVKFHNDGRFENALSHDFWKPVESRFIKISYRNEKSSHSFHAGAYSVYALSDSTLVLAQVLTSSGDWTKEYIFSNSQQSIASINWKLYWPWNQYSLDSVKDEDKLEYYENGSIKSVEHYKTARLVVPLDYAQVRTMPNTMKDTVVFRHIPTGEWTSYHPNGRIQLVSYYDDKGDRSGTWQWFLPNGELAETENYDSKGYTDYRDRYIYNKDIKFPVKERILKDGTSLYLIGSHDFVQLNKITLNDVKRVDSYSEGNVQITNLSSHKITLTVKANPALDLKSSVLEIEPHDTASLVLQMKVAPGDVNNQIQLASGEWSVDLNLHSFGYHLTNDDFDSSSKLQLPSKMYFHRTAEDHELEIVSKRKKKVVPISQQMSLIELEKGSYKFALIGKEGRKVVEVEVK